MTTCTYTRGKDVRRVTYSVKNDKLMFGKYHIDLVSHLPRDEFINEFFVPLHSKLIPEVDNEACALSVIESYIIEMALEDKLHTMPELHFDYKTLTLSTDTDKFIRFPTTGSDYFNFDLKNYL